MLCLSTLIEHSTQNPKIWGLDPDTGIRREKIENKALTKFCAPVTQWSNT
jgi:hypothetical protein